MMLTRDYGIRFDIPDVDLEPANVLDLMLDAVEPRWPEECWMDQWKHFRKGNHVEVIESDHYRGRFGRIVEITAAGNLHFIYVAFAPKGVFPFRPSVLRACNAPEGLAFVDENEWAVHGRDTSAD